MFLCAYPGWHCGTLSARQSLYKLLVRGRFSRNQQAVFGFKRHTSRGLVGLAVALALAGPSAAEPDAGSAIGIVALRLAGQAVSAPSAALPVADAGRNTHSTGAQVVLTGEPPALAGLLDAVNAMRQRVSAPPVRWSDALAMEAAKIAALVGEKSCTRSSAFEAAREHGASVYLSPALRSYDGSSRLQDIKPNFVAGEWRAWGAGYDAATQTCVRSGSGDCASYARLVAPTVRQVGCARLVCSSRAQVWTCKSGG